MKLGFMASVGNPAELSELEAKVQEAERLGFDSMWLGETYGPDVYSTLAFWAGKTTKLRLGTSVAQIWSRSPASTAMSAMTIDQFSGGRFILGLGVSGPQVVEGWYGQEFKQPLGRTREYIEIVRSVIRRDKPVEYHGKYYDLPVPGGTGLGKPIKSMMHPYRTEIPIFIGAEGPKNVTLTAEIADGWVATYLSPRMDGFYRKLLADGFARRNGPPPENFETVVLINAAIADTVEEAADKVRPGVAMYIGAMGVPGLNFHYDAVARLGYEDECAHIQERWLAGDRKAAIAGVTTKMVQDIALVGPKDKIRDDLAAWRETVATTLLVRGDMAFMRTIAEIVNA